MFSFVYAAQSRDIFYTGISLKEQRHLIWLDGVMQHLKSIYLDLFCHFSILSFSHFHSLLYVYVRTHIHTGRNPHTGALPHVIRIGNLITVDPTRPWMWVVGVPRGPHHLLLPGIITQAVYNKKVQTFFWGVFWAVYAWECLCLFLGWSTNWGSPAKGDWLIDWFSSPAFWQQKSFQDISVHYMKETDKAFRFTCCSDVEMNQ